MGLAEGAAEGATVGAAVGVHVGETEHEPSQLSVTPALLHPHAAVPYRVGAEAEQTLVH